MLSYLVAIGIILVINFFLTSKVNSDSTIQLLINILIFTFILGMITVVRGIIKKRKKK